MNFLSHVAIWDKYACTQHQRKIDIRAENLYIWGATLRPDPEKGKMDEAQELDRLAKVKASMTSADLAELAHATEELRLKQETPDPPEALKTVPSLVLSDIPKETATIPITVGELKGTTVLWHDLFTNDVLYAEVAFNLRTVKAELLPSSLSSANHFWRWVQRR